MLIYNAIKILMLPFNVCNRFAPIILTLRLYFYQIMDTIIQKWQNTLDAFKNRMYSYETLVSEVSPVRVLGRNPLFDVWLLLTEKDDIVTAQFNCLKLEFYDTGALGNDMAKFNLLFSFEETESGLRVTLIYKTDLFGQEKMNYMIDSFVHLMSSLDQFPGIKISSLKNYRDEYKRSAKANVNKQNLEKLIKIKNGK